MVKSLIRNLIIGAIAAVGGAVFFMVNGGSFKGCSTKEKAAETPASVEVPAEPGKN